MSGQSSSYALGRLMWKGCQTLSTRPPVPPYPTAPPRRGGGVVKGQTRLGAPERHPVALGLWERGLRERGFHTGKSKCNGPL